MRKCYTSPTSKTKPHYQILNTVAKVLNMQYASHDSSLILVQDVLGVRVYDTKTVSRAHNSLYIIIEHATPCML